MVMGRQEGTSSCRLGRKRKVVYLGRPLPKYVIMISDIRKTAESESKISELD